MKPKKSNYQKISLSQVAQKGSQVFGNEAEFNKWLDRSNLILSGQKPSEFIKTEKGRKLILQSLIRIENGIFI